MQFNQKVTNKFQKRPLRAEYAQHQATYVDSVLDPSFTNADGTMHLPKATDTVPLARSADAYTIKNGLPPGLVMLKNDADHVVVATGANTALHPYGLLANWVGGEVSDGTDYTAPSGNINVGVARGVNARFTLLAPAYDDTGLAAAYAAATPGNDVLLYAKPDGRLGVVASPGSQVPVARLVERVGNSRIRIDLMV